MSEDYYEDASQSYGTPMYDPGYTELIKWAYDSKEPIVFFEFYLRGKYYDPETDEFKHHGGDKMMNETGINEFISHFKVFLSNLSGFAILQDRREAYKFANHIADKVAKMIVRNMKEWDLTPGDADTISSLSSILVFFQLTKTIQGKSTGLIEKMERRNITVSQNTNENQGFLGNIMRRKK